MKFKLDECLDVRLATPFYHAGMMYKQFTKRSLPVPQMNVSIQCAYMKSGP